MDASVFSAHFRQQVLEELTGNILPFWMTHVVDRRRGGFHGAVGNDLRVHDEVPRAAVLCARTLWTFAAAARQLDAARYLPTARWAFEYLAETFWDPHHGGVFWEVDSRGAPVRDHKHHYAQAFALYGLSEYYRATGEARSLEMAQSLFYLLEQHAHDPSRGGYIEAHSRAWGPLADMRLSEKDLNCRKSMNMLLHLLEAYSNLLRAWPDRRLLEQHRALLEIFERHVVDRETGHLRLFFDGDWRSLVDHVSFGHDIEASWLLWEAAELQGDSPLLEQVRPAAIGLAESVLRDGLAADGSVLGEASPRGLVDATKAWWAQAEGLVGFYNAYQLTGDRRFARAASRCWEYAQSHLVDRTHGDWFKRLNPDGTPDHTAYKAGPWECPYHHSRACLEMLNRLQAQPGLSV